MSKGAKGKGSIQKRLFSRAESNLTRKSTPDGGSVYTGALVKRTLRAIGARAMTMDNTIFVSDDFNLSKAEDQALYAHERHHLMESGGVGENSKHDAEEQEAQAIERMVLHRSAAGDDISSILRDIEAGGAAEQGGDPGEDAPTEAEAGEALRALNSLLGSGKTYQTVVDELASFVVESISTSEANATFRGNS